MNKIEEIAKLEEFGNFLPLEPLRIPFRVVSYSLKAALLIINFHLGKISNYYC